jgi:hypothetical protein
LLAAHPPVLETATGRRCGAWEARSGEAGALLLVQAGGEQPRTAGGPAGTDGLDGLRALCVAHWSRHPDEGATVRVVAGDAPAMAALHGWGLGG